MKRFLAFLALVAISACSPTTPTKDIIQTAISQTQAAIAGTQTAIAETQNTIVEQPPTQPPPTTKTPTPPGPTVTTCWRTTAGTTVTCQIDRAYCSYRPDVNGSPTFCNDALYPTHNFTLLVWGQDWSDYEGQCLIVAGPVTRYKGKLQIVAESRSQVSLCR